MRFGTLVPQGGKMALVGFRVEDIDSLEPFPPEVTPQLGRAP